jgi:hypothetical protein
LAASALKKYVLFDLVKIQYEMLSEVDIDFESILFYMNGHDPKQKY